MARKLVFVKDKIRNLVIEECAKVAEAEAKTFLSPEYASNQPFGSLCERFACEQVAKAIRALAQPPAYRNTPTPSKPQKVCLYSDGCPMDDPVCHLCEHVQP